MGVGAYVVSMHGEAKQLVSTVKGVRGGSVVGCKCRCGSIWSMCICVSMHGVTKHLVRSRSTASMSMLTSLNSIVAAILHHALRYKSM